MTGDRDPKPPEAAAVHFHNNIGLTTLTDNGPTGISVRYNGGFNPDVFFAQGNVAGATTFSPVNGSTITPMLMGNVTATITIGKVVNDTFTLTFTQDATGSRTMT